MAVSSWLVPLIDIVIMGLTWYLVYRLTKTSTTLVKVISFVVATIVMGLILMWLGIVIGLMFAVDSLKTSSKSTTHL
jgi:hypothetical protein